MTLMIVQTPDGPRLVRDCDTDDVPIVFGYGDPTPVDDLEDPQADYDPAAATRLDAHLDRVFGLDGAS